MKLILKMLPNNWQWVRRKKGGKWVHYVTTLSMPPVWIQVNSFDEHLSCFLELLDQEDYDPMNVGDKFVCPVWGEDWEAIEITRISTDKKHCKYVYRIMYGEPINNSSECSWSIEYVLENWRPAKQESKSI